MLINNLQPFLLSRGNGWGSRDWGEGGSFRELGKKMRQNLSEKEKVGITPTKIVIKNSNRWNYVTPNTITKPSTAPKTINA